MSLVYSPCDEHFKDENGCKTCECKIWNGEDLNAPNSSKDKDTCIKVDCINNVLTPCLEYKYDEKGC